MTATERRRRAADNRAFDEVAFADYPGEVPSANGHGELGTFLDALYGSATRGELLFNYRSGDRFPTSWHGLDVAAVAAAVRRQPGDVWVPIGSRRQRLVGGRGGADDVLDVFAFAVDLDHRCAHHARDELPPDLDSALSLLDDFPLAPTVTVATGGGLQGWWFAAEPWPAEDAAPVLGRWGVNWRELGWRRRWHVDSTASLEHVFRLPGTRNVIAQADVAIIGADWTRRFGLDDLDEACIEETIPERPKPPKHDRADGERLAGDKFNERTDAGTLLEAHGFVLSHQQLNGDRHYYAPHRAESRERSGATVYAIDGHVAIWSETFASANGLKAKHGYDAFGLYARLEHGGDFKGAAKAIYDEDAPDLRFNRTGNAGATEPPPNVDPETGEIRDGLDDDFWNSRRYLQHIRQAAHARRVAPTAVLGAVLARVAAFTPPSTCVPAYVGSDVPLSLYVALIAATGGGKTSPGHSPAT